MSDFKSKLPDLKEISSMAGKLFKSLKHGITEIIGDYKKKRTVEHEHKSTTHTVKKEAKPTVKSETKTHTTHTEHTVERKPTKKDEKS